MISISIPCLKSSSAHISKMVASLVTVEQWHFFSVVTSSLEKTKVLICEFEDFLHWCKADKPTTNPDLPEDNLKFTTLCCRSINGYGACAIAVKEFLSDAMHVR